MIRYTNGFSEHNIDIGVFSNDSLYQIYKALKSIRRLLTGGKYAQYDMLEGIYNTRVPSWIYSLANFATFEWNGQKCLPVYNTVKKDKIRCYSAFSR